MRKVLASLLVVGVLSVSLVGATKALFSDTEASEDNRFVAGQIDLKVDYDGYYNKEVDGEPDIHWEMTDLNEDQKFFDFDDIKPGDYGEGTISLHLTSNPAWVRAVIDDVHNDENGCTEPEASDSGDTTCDDPGYGQGELAQNLHFRIWEDDGDNVLEEGETVVLEGTAADILAGASWDMGQVQPDQTIYYGVEWWVPAEVGNIIQTDSLTADITFEAEQVRHNPTPSWNTTPTPTPTGTP